MYIIQCYIEQKNEWKDSCFNNIEDYNEALKILKYCKSNAPHRFYRIDSPQPYKNKTHG